MKEIAVALGSGGARGSAHIGVLRVLEQAGYKIKAIAGTSIGGLVAALYALGNSPDKIEEIFTNVDQNKLYELGIYNKPALLGVGKISLLLDDLLEEKTFADTKIPCAMISVDLGANCEVTLNEGSLKNAVLSTIAVPGIFPPFQNDSHTFVDGGVLNPVPVSVARQLAPSLPVVAVALTMPLSTAPGRYMKASLPTIIPDGVVRRLTRLNVSQAMDIFIQAVDVGNRAVTELRLQSDPPDLLIRPELDHIALLDRVVIADVARLGEEAAKKHLPELNKLTLSSGFLKELFRRK